MNFALFYGTRIWNAICFKAGPKFYIQLLKKDDNDESWNAIIFSMLKP